MTIYNYSHIIQTKKKLLKGSKTLFHGSSTGKKNKFSISHIRM